jgi:hypothetical protein
MGPVSKAAIGSVVDEVGVAVEVRASGSAADGARSGGVGGVAPDDEVGVAFVVEDLSHAASSGSTRSNESARDMGFSFWLDAVRILG